MPCMTLSQADIQALKAFATHTTRSTLITRRKDGGVQTSPMSAVADDNGNVLTATRAANAKVHNLVRDPRAALCLFNDQWPGPWMHVEGEVSIDRLPEAMP